jgi:putative DNA primase/helicase
VDNAEDGSNIIGMPEPKIDEILSLLTVRNVVSSETFSVLCMTDNELLKEQRMQKLKIRAAQLGIKSTVFDSFRKAFERDQKVAAAKEKAKRDKEDSYINMGVAPYMDGKEIMDKLFYDYFAEEHEEIHCIHGKFYGTSGSIERKAIEAEVQEEIAPFYMKNTARKAKNLTDFIENACYMQPQKPERHTIHVKNGCIEIDKQYSQLFLPEVRFCLNRINASYEPTAPKPEKWLQFLDDLLEPEDQVTLQEYLGYCLLPTTKAQKMLIIIGNGGEGKSIIGAVMKELFGLPNIATGKLNSLEENRFQVANLENKLLFIDDDLCTAACEESAVVKEIVTCDGTMSMEQKGKQSYQGNMYCRLLAFGNQSINTLHDHSEGAYRRRIILTVKPKPPNRVDDKDLKEKLLKERSGILNWMLGGLRTLQLCGYEFSISEKAKANLEQSKRDSFNVIAFLEDDSAIQLGGEGVTAQCSAIYTAYQLWCTDNAEYPVTQKTLINYMEQHASTLKIRYSTHIHKYNHRARGFFGVEIVGTVNRDSSEHA